jgi:hypothetical protein
LSEILWSTVARIDGSGFDLGEARQELAGNIFHCLCPQLRFEQNPRCIFLLALASQEFSGSDGPDQLCGLISSGQF